MKLQLLPRSFRVHRHIHDFCVSPVSSQVFSLTVRAVPWPLLPQQPDAISKPTTPSHTDTGFPHLSSHLSTIQIP